MSELYDDPNDPVPVAASSDSGGRTVLVITNFPDQDSAGKAANSLLAARLVACANIMAPCQSVYRWQGKIETATEYPAWFKTSARTASRVVDTLMQLHPHEVPEVLVVNPETVLPAYNQWVSEQVD